MIYKAYSSDRSKLLSLPETGMGYQIIEGQLIGSYISNKYVVYNSELIVNLDNEFLSYKKQIMNVGFSTVLNESNFLGIKTDSIRLVSRNKFFEHRRYLSESEKSTKGGYSRDNGATDNPKEYANGKEIFVRVSAYGDDKRIDFIKKKLKDGAFTTTYKDYLDCVNSKDDPIDRYALPNNGTINWAFYILPKSIDRLQRGIVQPAFGHNGGGAEAYFEKGTSDKTYYDKRPYGK